MSPTREELERWDRDHVWHPFTPMTPYMAERPLIIERAEGCFLYDLDGNRYLDGVSSLWCNVHGHRVPQLDDSIRQQLDRVAHSTLLGISNIPAIELAHRLVTLCSRCREPSGTPGPARLAGPTAAPPGLTRVFFSDDGATAVEVALKMAFQYWRQCPSPKPQKTKYLSLNAAYHGDTLGAVSVGDLSRFHHLFAPLLFPVVHAPPPYCYRCPLGLERATCEIACAEHLVKLVEEHADSLAAVVIEPLVQAAAGMITAPIGYLRRVREATRAHNVLLIADEVAVGFGRTGTMFACEQEGVTPDFLCLAKGLTGGYLPLAATLTTEEVFAAFLGRPDEGRTFYHGHTFTGNPLGAAVALASIGLLEREVMPELPVKIELLHRHLLRLTNLPCVGEIRQSGLMVGVELVKDRTTKERFPSALRMGSRVCAAMREQGVLVRPLGDVIVVMPPLGIEAFLLDRLISVLYNAIQLIAEQAEG